MAFDFPIEADRVDNLNLFSVFLRAPVIGTVMWFISGGAARREEEEDDNRNTIRDDSGNSEPTETLQPRPSPPPSPLRGLHTMDEDIEGHHLPFKRMPPRLIHSDVSEIADNPFVAEAVSQYQASVCNNTAPLSKKEKKMSWSDESGRRLVEYVGDEVSKEPFKMAPRESVAGRRSFVCDSGTPWFESCNVCASNELLAWEC